jgi:hypothetical protein
MHFGRILAILGVVVAAVGLFLQSASSAGEAALEQLSQIPDAGFPSGFDNTWTAFYNENSTVAVIFAIAAIAAVAAALIPPLKEAMKRLYGLIVAGLGVVMLVIGIFATMGAMDDADTLQAGFAQVFAGGAIPEAYTVSIGYGWYLLILGGVIVGIGGVLSLMARPNENALSG